MAGAIMAAGATAIGELNREWFDSVAESAYQEGWVRDLVHQIGSFLGENIGWVSPRAQSGLKVLDYACGGGVVSMTLAPFASLLRGIDISGRMVARYNDAARQLGLFPDKMRAVRGDLLADTCPADMTTTTASLIASPGPESEPDDFSESESGGDLKFDVAVVSMALHHVADPAELVRRLAERYLAPGGSLVVVDWVAHGPGEPEPEPHHHHHHPAAHTITRHGFAEAEMRDMFAAAGLGNYAYLLHPRKSAVPAAGELQLFAARGVAKA